MPYQKVKACLFNEEGYRPHLVNFGVLNKSVTKTVELTAEQQKRVWTAFSANKTLHQLAPHIQMRLGYDGKRFIFVEGMERFENPPRDHKSVRRGLVCFDAQDRPVAWVAFSEKDGTRLMQPEDTTSPVLNGILWDPFVLGKIFDELGLPVPPKKAEGEK